MSGLVRRVGEGRQIQLTPEELFTVKASDADGNGRLGVFEVEVAHLGGPPVHAHKRLDEAFWVLEGAFAFRVGEQLLSGGPGTFVLVPGGEAHAFACTSPGSGKLLLIFSPGGAEAYFEDLSLRLASLPKGQPDPSALTDVLEQHEVAVLGPQLAEKLGPPDV